MKYRVLGFSISELAPYPLLGYRYDYSPLTFFSYLFPHRYGASVRLHRMDEVLSGVRSAIAIKIFGPNLEELCRLGTEVQTAVSDIQGLVELQLEPQVPIRQVQIQFNREAAARCRCGV